jgi:pimeloyl-ACP methyl ester carboxylesterase
VIGSGPVLLFPPSIMSILEWVSDSPTGRDFFAALAAHRTVVAYDRHGCGLSDRDRTDFTLADDVQDLEAVVGTIAQQRFDIVATSNVAPAVAFASMHPERVRRIVLLQPTLSLRTERYQAMLGLIEARRESWVQALTGMGFPNGADEASVQSVAHFLRTAASTGVLLGLLKTITPIKQSPSLAQSGHPRSCFTAAAISSARWRRMGRSSRDASLTRASCPWTAISIYRGPATGNPWRRMSSSS